MISAGSPQDLLRRAFVTEDFNRTSTRSSHKDNRFAQACAIDMHMDMSQEPCYARTDRKNAAPQDRDLGQPSCASLRNRNAPERCRTVTLCENVKEKYRASGLGQKAFCARMYSKKKCRAPEPGQQFCASLPGRNSRAIYVRICSKKCREVCEPAQSRCTWTYHKHQFVREFAAGQVERPDLTPALKFTVRTPQCAHRECVQMQGMSQGAFKTLEEDNNAMCCCVVNSKPTANLNVAR